MPMTDLDYYVLKLEKQLKQEREINEMQYKTIIALTNAIIDLQAKAIAVHKLIEKHIDLLK